MAAEVLLVADAGGLGTGVETCVIAPLGCVVVVEEGTRQVDFFAGPASAQHREIAEQNSQTVSSTD